MASGTQTTRLEFQVTAPLDGFFRLQITPTNVCFPAFTSSNIEVQAIGTIGANPGYSLAGNMANFTANISGVVTNVEWIFGFDESNMELNPSYTFPGPGTYSVVFSYSNECGDFSIPLEVIIADPIAANIGASSFMGCAPLTVLFEDQSIGNVINRTWLFPGGNPATSNEESQLVTFSTVGNYEVSLSVDNGVASSNSSITVMALAPPLPAFSVETNGLTVTLSNQSGNAANYLWNFGDGNTSLLENPTHTYTTPGVYEISLNASNANCGVALSQTISVLSTATTETIILRPELFPNPGNDQLYVKNGSGSTLQIWNSHGQLLQTTRINTPQQRLDRRCRQ